MSYTNITLELVKSLYKYNSWTELTATEQALLDKALFKYWRQILFVHKPVGRQANKRVVVRRQ